MEFFVQLWLPILLAAVFVFIVSSIFHMVLPIHRGDYRKMNNEDALIEALRAGGIGPGAYMFPCPASMKDMNSPEMIEKWKKGPAGILTVRSAAGCNMGKSLLLWFVFSLIVGSLAAYVGWHALGAGASYRAVFRVTGTAAILGYAVGYLQDYIWKGASGSTVAKFVFDGVIYGLVTAGTFGWMWPDAA